MTILKKCPSRLGIPASVGVGFMFRDVERHRWTYDLFAHVNGIALGSILSDHYQTDERNYNWASGFSIKGDSTSCLAKINWHFR